MPQPWWYLLRSNILVQCLKIQAHKLHTLLNKSAHRFTGHTKSLLPAQQWIALKKEQFSSRCRYLIHGKEKKDLLAKLAYNPHTQLRRTKDCMYLCQSWEGSIKSTFLAFSFLFVHSRFQVHWKWSGAFVFIFASLMISHNLGTPRIFHILLHWTPFDHIHKTAKKTGSEKWIHT